MRQRDHHKSAKNFAEYKILRNKCVFLVREAKKSLAKGIVKAIPLNFGNILIKGVGTGGGTGSTYACPPNFFKGPKVPFCTKQFKISANGNKRH